MPEGRCCCCSLQTGCILVGVFMGIWSVVGLIFEIVDIDKVTYPRDRPPFPQKQALLNVLWLLFVFYLASLVIGILLCVGASRRSVAMCKIWLFGNPILRILIVILSALSIHYGLFVDAATAFLTLKQFAIIRLVIGTMIVVGTGVWFFGVVFAFIKEIQPGPDPAVGVMVIPQYGQPMSPYPAGGEVVQYGGQEYGGFPQQPETPSQHLQMNQTKYAPPGGTTPPPTEMAT